MTRLGTKALTSFFTLFFLFIPQTFIYFIYAPVLESSGFLATSGTGANTAENFMHEIIYF
jgi:hypothetical protein